MRLLIDLVEQGCDCGELVRAVREKLHDHTRLEDRIIFGRLESLFTEQDLKDVADCSLALRREWGRPVGPQ